MLPYRTIRAGIVLCIYTSTSYDDRMTPVGTLVINNYEPKMDLHRL